MPPSPALLAAVVSATLACLASVASGQSQAATDPVAFISLSIPGTGGTATNAISFKALGVLQPVSYQGSADTVNIQARTLTDTAATWNDNDFNGAQGAHYVEIIRPAGVTAPVPGEGTTYDIAATDKISKTLTLVQPLDATIVSGALFRIRKHWTIGMIFGANNSAGFLGSGSSSTADQIQIWNGTSFTLYFFQIDPSGDQSLGGTGWRAQTSNSADASTTVIYPDDGLVFRLLQDGPVNISLLGAVKTGPSSFPISAGFNILANVYSAPMTLTSSGLQTSGFSGAASPSESDQILLWNGTGYDTYFYQLAAPALGGTGWRSATDTYADAGSTAIPAGAAVVVRRVQGSPFNWIVPQHPAAL